jgi:hypothetical protein
VATYLNDAKLTVIVVSFFGLLAGILYTLAIDPLNNYFVFMGLFALVGVGVANVVLIVVSEVYKWLKAYYADSERAQNAQNA